MNEKEEKMSSFKDKIIAIKDKAEAEYKKYLEFIGSESKIIDAIKGHKEEIEKILEEVKSYKDEIVKTGADGVTIAEDVYNQILEIKKQLDLVLTHKK